MKKIFYRRKQQENDGSQPFWKPWGAGGYIGRCFLFLILLFAFILLLSLIKSCEDKGDRNSNKDEDYAEDVRNEQLRNADLPDDMVNPQDPNPNPIVPIDDSSSEIRTNIPNPGPNLPSPERNYLPPINPDDIVTDDEQRQVVGNMLNVILDDPNVTDETYRSWANQFKSLYPGNDYQVVFYDPMTRLVKIQIPADQRENVMHNLPQQITNISFKIFPDGLMGPSVAKPNDPVFRHADLSWYFDPIQAYGAWEITKGSPEIVVAIVDSYFDLQHDDLNSDRVVKPYSIVRRTGNVAPEQGCDQVSFMHGSMVASQAIGNMNNSRGTAGIAPQCKFMPVSLGHQFTIMTILNGVLYAIYQGANVINVSAGAIVNDYVRQLPVSDQIAISKQSDRESEDVWEYVNQLANERNVTIVWAAGNQNVYAGLDPTKRSDTSIRVSAVDQRLKKADFSNFGNFPQQDVEASTISAPGVYIVGAMPFNTYNVGPGTSFAAPIVTGAVALIKSLSPSLTTEEIIRILQTTGKPIEGDNTIGKLLQIKDALQMVKGEMANFDDIMRDHNKLKGLWQSSILLYKTVNNQRTGDFIRLYFDVTSTTDATCILYETTTKRDFTAPVRIEWQNDKITFRLLSGPRNASTGETYMLSVYDCTPNSDRLLQCQQTNLGPSAEQVRPYQLRKVDRRVNE